VGDTVGDPCKFSLFFTNLVSQRLDNILIITTTIDTSGPAINIMIKLADYSSVVLAPLYVQRENFWWVSFIIFGLLFIICIIIYFCSVENIEKLFLKRKNSNKAEVKPTVSTEETTVEESN
jgi:large-conductance mechanosensitive channel